VTNNKQKIIIDPVYGFITIPNEFIFGILSHPYVQRLNRIKQMGLASYVYPGAHHTRLNHSIGAMYLMQQAISTLRNKGHEITEEESDGALACILLHDIGHGPFSHSLEYVLLDKISHEDISLLLMEKINRKYNGTFDLCISIFRNEYVKRFLHQLVSGQLDVDRLDYLRRDSFFTGVSEANIGSERIIKLVNIKNDNLVVESKGIYSIENFLTSRRLMYWQVYLHKTSVAAEKMLINIMLRAKELSVSGIDLFASPSLKYFLNNRINRNNFTEEALCHYINIDDSDIWAALKVWAQNDDIVLSTLSRSFIDRDLFKINAAVNTEDKSLIEKYKQLYCEKYNISLEEASYFISSDVVTSKMYSGSNERINILYNDGSIKDISEASDMLDIELLSKKVEKYYFSHLKI